ncbi:hypothetical protein ANN_19391 [Periplaneta americana]|uniref:Peptidase A2 domain-containing protein n=1 Tax=Periplaneta americana TaxID=6978 RepID=A0ABQ8SAN3_PERAM|nr:hypothetical protein ANN_19391 [Periplaneta americana]
MNCNTIPVRTLPGRTLDSTHCRRCDEQETLPHVLGFCHHGELLRINRHNTVRSLIAASIRQNASYEVYEEVGCVPSDGSTRRADIIIIDRQKDKGVILDPTIRFEMHEQQPQEEGIRGASATVPKRDRSYEENPVVGAELQSHSVLVAPSALNEVVSEPRVDLEIEGKIWEFVVDTGATVSLIKPTVSSALITESDVVIRGANGQKVKTFGTQTVKFLMGSEQFEFKFVISDIRISAAGIIGMEFLRYVGARIDVQSNSLVIGRQTVTLINTDLQSCNVASVSGKSGSVSAMASQSSDHDQLDWSGPILLAESVVLPPHTVKIVRGKVMGRHNLSCNPKTSQVLLVEPTSDQDGLPGIHVARSISQLGNFRTIVNDARGHSSLWMITDRDTFEKSP